MNPDEFIATVKQVVHDSAVRSVTSKLKSPPGRRPPRRLTELSQWFHSLSPTDQHHVSQVIQHAVHSSIFGFLCVLDGVRAIEAGSDKGILELALTRDTERQLLNDPEREPLHEIYQSLVYSEVFGTD